ncbi:hypothetical protein CC86DRAFT_373832 [Ophiobolus disseminans]|uniref:Uncharacterized protein n=1 Tax=Ophiobolus disseminans TaxID=1469910 RepID=A0A6A6ZKE0_9PLEO|nr:hypothetical protein CC86DRAFT_373832 [Ophiobolus disseminans]
MKFVLATALSLTSLVAAAALPTDEFGPRVNPRLWIYSIKSFKGPGCPDFGKPEGTDRTTRLTFGQNTVDGTEIYYWFVAYPHLRVSTAGETHSWCETEVAYKEFSDLDAKVPANDYRLRLHKNGTRVIATYDLEAGTKATFKFTYEAGDDEITDTVALQGPLASGTYQQEHTSPVSKDPELYKFPKCGTATIKFRTDLYISGEKGKKGVVDSEHSTDKAGKEQYYGIQQGFSYDWEKCGK